MIPLNSSLVLEEVWLENNIQMVPEMEMDRLKLFHGNKSYLDLYFFFQAADHLQDDLAVSDDSEDEKGDGDDDPMAF